MGTLSVQPPTGMMRNITEVFILLRNNSFQSKFININETTGTTDEKMCLVNLDEEGEKAVAGTFRSLPPDWINYLDETQYEFTRIRSRLKQIREMQQNHIAKPCFIEDSEVQQKMDISTDEVTQMFSHCQRLIGFIEKSNVPVGTQQYILRGNVMNTLRCTLSNMANDFRTSQAKYLKQIESRKETVNSYLLTPSSGWVNMEILDSVPVDNAEELTMEQIQLLLQNADIVKEREKDVLSVSKSIVELNTIFKDLASLITDQGSILDRIDFNVEQTSIRIQSALQNIEKAEKYQRNDKKMHCIVILSVTIIILLLLLIIVKT